MTYMGTHQEIDTIMSAETPPAWAEGDRGGQKEGGWTSGACWWATYVQTYVSLQEKSDGSENRARSWERRERTDRQGAEDGLSPHPEA